MKTDAMFSSKTGEWTTPQDLFDALNTIYKFDLDPAATAENAKCTKYFTKEDDGLRQDWGGHRVFCNPPYGREIGKWVKKGWEEAQKPGTTVVLLLPSRTDTAWFQDYCLKGKIHFYRGRLYFGVGDSRAPFPSIIVTFEGVKDYAKGKLDQEEKPSGGAAAGIQTGTEDNVRCTG